MNDFINCDISIIEEINENIKSNNNNLSGYIMFLLENIVLFKEKFERILDSLNEKISKMTYLKEEYHNKYLTNSNLLETSDDESLVIRLKAKNKMITQACSSIENNIEQMIKIKSVILDKKEIINNIDLKIRENISNLSLIINEISTDFEKIEYFFKKYSSKI